MRKAAMVCMTAATVALLLVGGCSRDRGTGAGTGLQPGFDDTRRVPITSVADLGRLGLVPSDKEAGSALMLLTEIIASRIEASTFTLAFRSPAAESGPGAITGPEGFVLESIAECGGIIREEEDGTEDVGCTHVFPPGLEGLETLLHPERYRGMQCGNIATIHSAVKLGLLVEASAYDGDYLNQDHVRALNQYHHFRSDAVGMTSEELQDAHKSYANAQTDVECIYPLRARTNAPSIGGVLGTAASLVNNQSRVIDCSLEVRGDYDADGKPRISHTEHITSMRQTATGEWEIMTLDGFNQGKTDATIPKAPDSNTWEFGANTGRFKGGSQQNMAQFGQVVFEHITINCCYGTERL